MKTIIVREPNNEKLEKINLSQGGKYFDDSRILWDSSESKDIPAELSNELKAQEDSKKAEALANLWKDNRQAEYPSIEECIHAILDGGQTLTDLHAARKVIKEKYPKGE